MKPRIAGIVALYCPKFSDIKNIENYVEKLDLCVLMDDTGADNREMCIPLLKRGREKVVYIANEKNIGLCASVNRGFKYAVEKGADWVLVMNPDGLFQNNAIDIYSKYISEHDCRNIAIITPQYNYDRHKRKSGQGVCEISYADMAGSLYNAGILKKLGYYDQNIYLDGLDVEYCLRVRKNGYQIVRCREAVLDHHPAETKELRIGSYIIFRYGKDSPIRYYYQFRSALYIHHIYHDWKSDLFSVYKYLKIIFLFDNKTEYLKMAKEAKRDYKRNYFGKYPNGR